MKINAIRVKISATEGDFGFNFQFGKNLTIIRANNTSGKSTLINCLLYGLGMEELIGGKGERTLSSAVKDAFDHGQKKIQVLSSEVWLEIENSQGAIVTLRRAIKDKSRDSKLIEIYPVAFLTEGETPITSTPTYLHDPGSAKNQGGFYHYLEQFLQLSLPRVPTVSGSETKLYIQCVYTACAVEQKRGWTDYLANMPFFGIRDARTRVVEYILGLDVFETNSERNRLNQESIEIDKDWRSLVEQMNSKGLRIGAKLVNLPATPTVSFDPNLVAYVFPQGQATITLSEHLSALRSRHASLEAQRDRFRSNASQESIQAVDSTTEELSQLNLFHGRSLAYVEQLKISLSQYGEQLEETNEDLSRNKTAGKLQELGAKFEFSTSSNICPTCDQPINESLIPKAISGPQMDLASNIRYLDSQRKMLERQILGIQQSLADAESNTKAFEAQIRTKTQFLANLRGDISTGAAESRAVAREQAQIELEIEALERLVSDLAPSLNRINALALKLRENQAFRNTLPKSIYTESDESKIRIFEKQFRANAGSFGYESAPINEIGISFEKLTPSWADIELREVIDRDIQAESSASDFIRLIWSYLLALHQTSALSAVDGRHLGQLILDEPGQHSMAAPSQHALLKQLAAEKELQSIVSASFDETEEVFLKATAGIAFELIRWEGKLIQPLDA
ncbi:MAG: AAA family ATPase [Burkholderiales bacterium]|nr:AAA family ATPase [Burkholderiales bacterium]